MVPRVSVTPARLRPLPALRLLLGSALLFTLPACCCAGLPRGALSTPPDVECMTGLEAGEDIAIWNCVDGGHVVAWRTSSPLGCSGVTVQQAACGELTPFEQNLSQSERDQCHLDAGDAGLPDGG